jgi:hypothetical protein
MTLEVGYVLNKCEGAGNKGWTKDGKVKERLGCRVPAALLIEGRRENSLRRERLMFRMGKSGKGETLK